MAACMRYGRVRDLAKELGASLTLIDERKARLLAKAEGVNVIGSVAVLKCATAKGILPTYEKFIKNFG
jgi:predicted nucleic acid-binding protein